MAHNKHRPFDPDSLGHKGTELMSSLAGRHKRDEEIVGTRWFHLKTQRIYQVVGIGFDSERERWTIRYSPEGVDNRFDYHHLPEDFFREGRFMQIKED